MWRDRGGAALPLGLRLYDYDYVARAPRNFLHRRKQMRKRRVEFVSLANETKLTPDPAEHARRLCGLVSRVRCGPLRVAHGEGVRVGRRRRGPRARRARGPKSPKTLRAGRAAGACGPPRGRHRRDGAGRGGCGARENSRVSGEEAPAAAPQHTSRKFLLSCE